jgi:hypothetical protein
MHPNASLALMADDPKLSAKARRDARLEAALRQNLKRRKAQARGRAERSETDDAPEPPPALTGDEERAN